MSKLLRAELWEIQVLLMWILDLMLFDHGHRTLGWVLLVWSIIGFWGVLAMNRKARDAGEI